MRSCLWQLVRTLSLCCLPLLSVVCLSVVNSNSSDTNDLVLKVDNFLKNKLFDRSDAVNADLLDDLSEVVTTEYKAAKKAKKPMKVKLVAPDKEVTLAQLTEAYISEGMGCINTVGRARGVAKKRGARERRNRAAFDELARLASEEPEDTEPVATTEAETAVAPEAEDPAETADT